MDTPRMISTTAAEVGELARKAQTTGDELGLLLHEKSPYESAQSLQREVKSFADACEVLHSLLNGLMSAKNFLIGPSDEGLYIKIQQAMSEYSTTLDQLCLSAKKARSSESRFLRPKPKIKEDDLIRARQRIESHLLNTQLMLGVLNL